MAGVVPVPVDGDAGGYCEPEDVVQYFDRFDHFEADSDQPRDHIKRQIMSKSERIDTKTGHAWRERKVEDEMHDLDQVYRFGSGQPISLSKRAIRTPLDPDKGDKIELYEGGGESDGAYHDLVADGSKNEGRNGDYWVDSETGMLHVYRRGSYFTNYQAIRVSYRYGQKVIPADITEVCAKLVAADLMESDFYRYTQPGNEEAPDAENIAEKWREQSEKDLHHYNEVRSTGL